MYRVYKANPHNFVKHLHRKTRAQRRYPSALRDRYNPKSVRQSSLSSQTRPYLKTVSRPMSFLHMHPSRKIPSIWWPMFMSLIYITLPLFLYHTQTIIPHVGYYSYLRIRFWPSCADIPRLGLHCVRAISGAFFFSPSSYGTIAKTLE